MEVSIKHILKRTILSILLITFIGCNPVIEPETVDSSNASSSEASVETVSVNISIPSTHTLASTLPSGLSLQGNLISGNIPRNSTLSIKLTAACYDPIDYVHVNIKNSISTTLSASTRKKYQVEVVATADGVGDITDEITLAGISSNPAEIDCGTNLNIIAAHSSYPNTYATATITEDTTITMDDWIVSSISFPSKARDTYYFNELSSTDRVATVSHNGTMTCSTDGTNYGSCNSATTMVWTQPSNEMKYIKITKNKSDDRIYSFNPHDDRAKVGFATYDCDITVNDSDGSMTFLELIEYESGAGSNMFDNRSGSGEKVICINNVQNVTTSNLSEGGRIEVFGEENNPIVVIAKEDVGLTLTNNNTTATGDDRNVINIANGGYATLVGLKAITTVDGGTGIEINATAPEVKLHYLEVEAQGNASARGIVILDSNVYMNNVKAKTTGSPTCHAVYSTAKNTTWRNSTFKAMTNGHGLSLEQNSDLTLKNITAKGTDMAGVYLLDPAGNVIVENSTFNSNSQALWLRSFNTTSTGGPVVVRDSFLRNSTTSTDVVALLETNDTNTTTQINSYFYDNVFRSYNGRPGIWNSDSITSLEGNVFARMIGSYTYTSEPAIQNDDSNATYNQVTNSTTNDNTACYQQGSVAFPLFATGATNSGNFLGSNQENHTSNSDIYNCSYYGVSI